MTAGIRRFSIGAVLLCALVGVAIFAHRGGDKAALVKYRAELRARGEKLTFRELSVPPSTNAEEVASRQFLATNVFSNSTAVLELMVYAGPGLARVAWRAEDAFL